ncbi:hypothetical protein FRB99_007082, partial [Tulasnella sp. 403]
MSLYHTASGKLTFAKLWDLEKRKLMATYQGHEKFISAIDISPDDTTLLSASDDHTIRVWGINDENTELIAVHNTAERPIFLTFHDAFPTVAVSYWDGGIQLLDSRGWDVITDLPAEAPAWTLRFTPGSQRLYGASSNGSIYFWEVEELLQLSNTAKTRKPAEKIDGVL